MPSYVTGIIDKRSYDQLYQGTEWLERKLREVATWETYSRDKQLAGDRGLLERILSNFEFYGDQIHLKKMVPGRDVNADELFALAESMTAVAERARRLLNQPRGRYTPN